ncbi:MAG TPA: FUSC family protein, partial [Streptosporangiaceae bacterium]|nr:FUSC family protein [Streptosporangiaceae bacterium]
LWVAAAAMAAAAFGVTFAGVVSSVLAGATTSLLLAFILPVSLPGPISSIPARLAGWGMASGAALVAVALLWPTPMREPLREAAVAACRAMAARLRAEVAYMSGGKTAELAAARERATAESAEAMRGLSRTFLATPNRPTGLSTSSRTTVRLVDELTWLDAIVVHPRQHFETIQVNEAVIGVKTAAATVLDRGADLLAVTGGDPGALRAAYAQLRAALARMEEDATGHLPVRSLPAATAAAAGTAGGRAGEEGAGEFVTSLEPSFRAQEVGFAVSLIARDIHLTAAAERRSWRKRILGRQPEGLPGTLAAATERATSHVERHSVWLHNSVRAAAALGLAVVVARLTGVQHSFWVVLGALSVLRSNALNTGQNAVRAIAGTVAGFAIGAALILAVGTNTAALWVLLPVAIFFAGVAPAAISFAAGQAAFTVTLLVLFNLIAPAGWRVGLLRIEDVALGCAVSLVVGVLFWPRGAAAALRRTLAEAYTASAGYLTSAVDFGMSRCDGCQPEPEPAPDATRAAAAARRLDDAFRTYLAERGAKPARLAEVTRLVTGVAGLRLAASAVLDLWDHADGDGTGDRTAARREVLGTAERVQGWYDDFAARLVAGRAPQEPLGHDQATDSRLVEAVRHDLRGEDGNATATAVRMIWTEDHLDAARRLQEVLTSSAPAVASGTVSQDG